MRFGRFRLDLRAGVLWRDDTPIALRPKTFAVLEFLVRHPGELVSKEALLDAIWSDVAVTDDMPRLSIGELRRALGDDRRNPALIVTVPRRGYRFVAPCEPATAALARGSGWQGPPSTATREAAVATLTGWLDAALSGTCQVGVVTGELGSGKTTLIEAFLLRHGAPASAGGRPGLRVAWGECLEQYGRAEPYLCVLEALRRLARRHDAESARATLRHHAPAWLLRGVGLTETGETAAGPVGARLRSTLLVADAVAALSVDEPLILVLEDLQWSSHATVDLLNLLAHRRDPARLLVLGSLREGEAMARRHPVTGVIRELHRRRLCDMVELAELSEAEIAADLALRLPGALPGFLPSLLLDLTEGNPLFLTALVDDLLTRGMLRREETGWSLGVEQTALAEHVPKGLLTAVEPQLARLSAAELGVLEAASIAGMTFDSQAIASALGVDAEAVEECCDALAERHELLRRMAAADDRASGRYGFRHALHRQVIRRRIPALRRWRLEQAVAAGPVRTA